MNIEKEREAFEHWVSEFGLNISTEDGLYRSHVVGWMWNAWQAGRAALQTQDREDAERYRRLRIGDIDDIAVVRGLGTMDYGMSAVIGTYSEEIDGDDLDAAIDNARRIEDEIK